MNYINRIILKIKSADKILLCLFLALALCVGYITYGEKEYTKAERSYDQLRDFHEDIRIMVEDIINTKVGATETIKNPINWKAVLAQNSEIVAWIFYPEANIDYPILCVKDGKDPMYYIDKTIDGVPNNSGSIFILPDQDNNFQDTNTFIYGHNMRNQTMFGTLKVLHNTKSISDPYFYIYLPTGEVYEYWVCGTATVEKGDDIYSVPDEEFFDKYVSDVHKYSKSSGVWYPEINTENYLNKMVTLSTCYGYKGTDKRLLFFGILNKIYNSESEDEI